MSARPVLWLTCLATVALVTVASPARADATRTVTFTGDYATVFPNPDRGFHNRYEIVNDANVNDYVTAHSEAGFNPDELYHGSGCDRCRKTGYSGRLGIYEMLVMDDTLRDMVTRNPNVVEFRQACHNSGLVTLRSDGLHKANKGLTTVDEILRVTESGA